MAMENDDMFGIYDVGTGHGTTVLNFCNHLIRLMDCGNINPIITHEKRRYDLRDIIINNERLISTGFKFKYDLMDGLIEYVKWFEETMNENTCNR